MVKYDEKKTNRVSQRKYPKNYCSIAYILCILKFQTCTQIRKLSKKIKMKKLSINIKLRIKLK